MFGLSVLLTALALAGAPNLPAHCDPTLSASTEAQTHYPSTSAPADGIALNTNICGGILVLGATPAERKKIAALNPGVDIVSKESLAAIVILLEAVHATHAYQADETGDLCSAEKLLPDFLAKYVPASDALAKGWVDVYIGALNPSVYHTHPC